jgi:hypothetical protein
MRSLNCKTIVDEAVLNIPKEKGDIAKNRRCLHALTVVIARVTLAGQASTGRTTWHDLAWLVGWLVQCLTQLR